MTFYGIEEWAANAIVAAAAIVFRNCSKGLEITPEAEMTKEKEVNSREQNRPATKEQRGLEDNVAMSEATGPRFRLICDDARDCMARYCFENAKYWAIWNRSTTSTKSLMIKNVVWGTHREAIEGKSWDEVSEDFRTTGQSKAQS